MRLFLIFEIIFLILGNVVNPNFYILWAASFICYLILYFNQDAYLAIWEVKPKYRKKEQLYKVGFVYNEKEEIFVKNNYAVFVGDNWALYSSSPSPKEIEEMDELKKQLFRQMWIKK